MNSLPETLDRSLHSAFERLGQARATFAPELTVREVGKVLNVSTGIALVSGLPNVGFEELVQFPGGILGIAFNLDEDSVGVILLGDYEQLQAGDEVTRTGRVMDVAVGDSLIGRVLDPLGRPLDGGGPIVTETRLPVERPAPPIMDRAPVVVPLQTGIKVIDALIPIGRGQRELILGDRQTGKSAIAIDTILNQRGKNVLCVYCAIGQRASAVAKAVASLRDKGAMDYTVVVVAEGNEAPGVAYITPYAATSIAEHFMEQGRDVLIVYDDLTHHARAYRELSLLLRRPPGREAFPGDIFYIHSRMLERATRLSPERGGGSLTALPIIETDAQDISAYIPTNLISITDGQIYLSPTLFELGILPAVDVGKSVSRVGGAAQRAAYRSVAGALKLAYSQFEELETFARFGTRLDDSTRRIIDHGLRIRACLKQSEGLPASLAEQICVLLVLSTGMLDQIPLDRIPAAEESLRQMAATLPAEVVERFASAPSLSDADRKCIAGLCNRRAEAVPTRAMSGTTEELRRRIGGAEDLGGVVRSMKAVAASSIGQYERAVTSLQTYSRTVQLGLIACLREGGEFPVPSTRPPGLGRKVIGAVLFGTDQGLVGRFNEALAEYAVQPPSALAGPIATVWAVGERMQAACLDAKLPEPRRLRAPNSVNAITALVGQILIEIEAAHEKGLVTEVSLYHNRPKSAAGYEPWGQRLLPLDELWRSKLLAQAWPTKLRPEVIQTQVPALRALIRGYLFVLLFQACAESLASENTSRLGAMQRAEKNIEEILEDLNRSYHRIRQEAIDEELFDVIAGYEALTSRRR